ncbi:MAG: ROK family protein [Acidobacteria bacterium]|nr:ROK family protein [Acidobacteriota bacterium]MBK8149987.1 ROK family protein [Acidobacteriota bacterium]MBK8810946.1 ROK family protein [Acidobacteriota bacterium]
MKKVALACDLGGTNLRMAAVEQDGRILFRTKRDTPKSDRADAIVRTMVDSANECRSAIGDSVEIVALAAAVPATVNVAKGVMMKAPNLPSLDGFRMVAAVESELNIRTLIENDATSAALGESWLGASMGYENSIMVTLGTGVGGGIIINGVPLRGPDGTGGEIGHICVEPFGAPCGCGARGCVEQYSSATAVVRLTRDLENQYPKSVLQNKSGLSSLDIYEAGKVGDELALEVFRQMGFYLGIALADLINVLNPEVIVIGGGASAGWDLFIEHVRDQISDRAFREPAMRAKIVRATLGDDAGLLGAARLAFGIS